MVGFTAGIAESAGDCRAPDESGTERSRALRNFMGRLGGDGDVWKFLAREIVPRARKLDCGLRNCAAFYRQPAADDQDTTPIPLLDRMGEGARLHRRTD